MGRLFLHALIVHVNDVSIPFVLFGSSDLVLATPLILCHFPHSWCGDSLIAVVVEALMGKRAKPAPSPKQRSRPAGVHAKKPKLTVTKKKMRAVMAQTNQCVLQTNLSENFGGETLENKPNEQCA